MSSPASACSRLLRQPVNRIELSVRPADAAAGDRQACGLLVIPLMMALNLAAEVDEALARSHDPRQTPQALLGEIADWRIEPAP